MRSDDPSRMFLLPLHYPYSYSITHICIVSILTIAIIGMVWSLGIGEVRQEVLHPQLVGGEPAFVDQSAHRKRCKRTARSEYGKHNGQKQRVQRGKSGVREHAVHHIDIIFRPSRSQKHATSWALEPGCMAESWKYVAQF